MTQVLLYVLGALKNLSSLRWAFAKSLYPDQDNQYIWPDLDPNCLTLMVFLTEFLEKVNVEKKSATNKIFMKNYPAGSTVLQKLLCFFPV